MIREITYLLDEKGDKKLSVCKYDKERCCNCMTYSILSDDLTHYECAKCGATK